MRTDDVSPRVSFFVLVSCSFVVVGFIFVVVVPRTRTVFVDFLKVLFAIISVYLSLFDFVICFFLFSSFSPFTLALVS